MMAKKKEKNIADLSELKQLFLKENNAKNTLALSLLDKAEFLEQTLQNLKLKVNALGVITSMCQGAYDIDRENPALKSYNTTIKNYTMVVKQLNDMLPKNEERPKDDGFESFGED